MDRQPSFISIWLQLELCAMAVLLTKGIQTLVSLYLAFVCVFRANLVTKTLESSLFKKKTKKKRTCVQTATAELLRGFREVCLLCFGPHDQHYCLITSLFKPFLQSVFIIRVLETALQEGNK